MIDVGDAVYAILSNNAAVAAVVPGTGNNAGTGRLNIFPDEAPKGIGLAPYVVYKTISDVVDATLDQHFGLAHARVQLDCIGPAISDRKAVSKPCYDAMQGASGVNLLGSGVSVFSVLQASQHTFVTPAVDDDNLRTFGLSMDFEIWFYQNS